MRKINNNVAIIATVFALCITIIILSITIKDLAKADGSNGFDNKDTVISNNEIKVFKTETSNYISYIVEDYERNLTYSWEFLKTDEAAKAIVDNIALDINLRIRINDDSKVSKLLNKKINQKKLIINFEHHGKLPSKAKVRINVDKRFLDGEELYLYYYNEEAKKIEFIDKDLKVSNGYIEFEIDHCSDYFLTGAIVPSAVNNPKSVNYIIIALGGIVFVLIAITLFKSKK